MGNVFSAAEGINSLFSLRNGETESAEQSFGDDPKKLDGKPIKGGYYGPLFRGCVKVQLCLRMEALDGKIKGVF
jgi:hypothetical protein